jgi:small-conductance mechanosensitive channel
MPASKSAPVTPPAHQPSVSLQQQISGLFNSTIDWVQAHWLQIIIAGVIGAVIAIILYALRGLGTKLCRPGRPRGDWMTIIGRAVSKTNSFFIIMVAVRLVAGYAQPPQQVEHVVELLATIATVFQAAIWVREIALGAIEHRTSAEGYRGEAVINAMGLIRLLISVVVFAIALVVLLDNLGVNVTGLVAGLGVGGIAIGLAAQGIFADLFAALAIIFDRPFSKGDVINYDNSSGTVESIGLKSTRIRAFSGELRVIANKNLLDKEILNVTGRDHIRLPFTIGVAYETPPETLARIPDILKELVKAEGANPARAGFESFGASSLDFTLFVDVPGSDWSVAHPLRDRLLVSIMKRFAAEGINIPYPTQTTYTAAPDGKMIMPYPEVQPVKRVDLRTDEAPATE